jgi:hypothetical protein
MAALDSIAALEVRSIVTRRKWRIKRMMAVPATWQGTPERFYHFLLGYFVPLVLWQESTGAREIAVRDSAPQNAWFDLLRPDTTVEILPPGVMLQRLLSHGQERIVLHDWDNPTRFHRRSLEKARKAVLGRFPDSDTRLAHDRPRITILERRPSIDHYRSDRAELLGGGADWRSLPNINDLMGALGSLGDVNVVDTAGMSPREQVDTLRCTDLLVAQHGGGLSNMIWMPAGAAVIEILPPRPTTIDTIFRNLASASRLAYEAVPQADEHAPVDPEVVTHAAQEVLTNPTACVPVATGSLPMRMLRQLPRRW